MHTWIGAVFTAALAGACSTPPRAYAPRPIEPRPTVEAAVNAGAEQDPEAADYLRQARLELVRAESHDRYGNPQAAAQARERAGVDAALALARAQEASQRADAHEAQREVDALATRPDQEPSE